MNLTSGIINNLRSLKKAFRRSKTHLHKKAPHVFGHEINNELIQLYRNDSTFGTVLSFSHFLEFYTGFQKINLAVFIKAYDRMGKECGRANFTIQSKGVNQIGLDHLISNLDEYGFYSLSIQLNPKFDTELAYLGALSPQFMTLFVPRDAISAPQMLHSHKKRDGFLPLLPYKGFRQSAHIEFLAHTNQIQLFVINSSRSRLSSHIDLIDSQTGKVLQELAVSVPGLGCELLTLGSPWLTAHTCESLLIEYRYDKPLSHNKPILFRQNTQGAWSCNHT